MCAEKVEFGVEDGIGTAQSAGFYLIRVKIPAVIQTKEDRLDSVCRVNG